MLTTADLLSGAKLALERVFHVDVQDAHIFWGDEPLDGVAMAHLNFAGDYAGLLSILLPKDQVRRAVKWVLTWYDIRVPVEDHEVFSEMLNMYAANLAMELQRHHVALTIGTPSGEGLVLPSARTMGLCLKTAQSMDFVFIHQFS